MCWKCHFCQQTGRAARKTPFRSPSAVRITSEVLIQEGDLKPRSRNVSAGLQVANCPFRSGRFLVNTQMKSVSLCYRTGNRIHLGEARTIPRTLPYPSKAGPGPKLLLHACFTPQVTRSYTVMSRCLTSSLWFLRGAAVVPPRRAAHVVPLRRGVSDATEE